MTHQNFSNGYETAFGIIDYIGAIPAIFLSREVAEFWRGYIAGEMERASYGKRSVEELQRAVNAYCNALISSNF